MKIGVIADTHGNLRAARQALARLESMGADIFLHLGDGVSDLGEILPDKTGRLERICGNNEDTCDFPAERVYDWAGMKILATHGHRQGLNPYLPKEKYLRALENLSERARLEGARIVLFAHTHRQEDTHLNGVRLLNPGALDLGTSPKSCLLLDLSRSEPRAIFVELAEG